MNLHIKQFICRYIHHIYKKVWSPQTLRGINALS